MKKLVFSLLSVILVSTLILAGCASSSPAPAPSPSAPMPAATTSAPPTSASPVAKPAPSSSPVQPAGKTININSVAIFSPPNFQLTPYNDFIKLVNERAKGEVFIKPIGGPEAIPQFDQGMACKRGVVQMAFIWQGAYNSIVPEAKVMYFSTLTYAQEQEKGVLKLMREVHEKQGLYYLGKPRDLDPNGLFFLWSKKKVEKPQNLSGLKVASESAANIVIIKGLGAIPTILPYSEGYTAMERGVVDYWITTPISLVQTLGMQNLVKFEVNHGFYQDATAFLFNLDIWNSLSPNVQKIMQDTYNEVRKNAQDDYIQQTTKVLETCKSAGVQFVKFSDQDAKWYIDTIYAAAWKDYVGAVPDYGPKFQSLMK